MSTLLLRGLGWQPDIPDGRDYTFQHDEVRSLLLKLPLGLREDLSNTVDLRRDSEGEYFSEVGDQACLNASSAFAVLSTVEYFERRIRGRTYDGSRLFLYQVTRYQIEKTQQRAADAGADLRSTIKTLVHFGVPPESYWPYDTEQFPTRPSPFLYSMAKPPPGLKYFRIADPGSDGEAIWQALKSFLDAGFPILFGFPVPSSLTDDPDVPFRPQYDSQRGGQAVVAVGYQLNRFGPKQHAILVRSSWGSHWGDHGNGWLPVGFIQQLLAREFWCLMCEDWLDRVELFRPSIVDSANCFRH